MKQFKHHWRNVHPKARRPIVLLVGGFFILLSGLIGWIPGPGGMVPFLLGIAILASEFTWAERLRDYMLSLVARTADQFKRSPVMASLAAVLIIATIWLLAYAFYIYVI